MAQDELEDTEDLTETSEDLPVEEKVFSDDFEALKDVGIPADLVDSWKKKYGLVFTIAFLDERYVYRNFNYQEYKKMRADVMAALPQASPVEIDLAFKEEVLKCCMLWPSDFVKRMETNQPKPIPGGLPGLLGDYILAASGFSDSLVPDIISVKK